MCINFASPMNYTIHLVIPLSAVWRITLISGPFPCTDPDAPDECRPRQQSSCRANETCLAVGAGGRYTCIGRKLNIQWANRG